MREIEVGGRVLVTTLQEPGYASAQALDRLYAMRWNIEVDFRTIKATLEMDVLRCKSSQMIEKEIAVCMLAYNLVR
ncbi:MAG: transposase, partial [Polaromonas sp.]